MKKFTAAILALIATFALTACGGAEDVSAGADAAATSARVRETEAAKPTTTAATTTATAEAATEAATESTESAADLARGHGITLDTEYYLFGNSFWGSMTFTSDGEVIYKVTDMPETTSTWTADGNGVYVANYEGEEHKLTLYEDGYIFELDTFVASLAGHEPYVTYSGTYVYDGDHEWLDVIELDGSMDAGYKNLDENYIEIEQGGATALSYSDKLILTRNLYDGTNEPVILTNEDGGVTFSDGWYEYYLYGSTEYEENYFGGYSGDSDGSGEYDYDSEGYNSDSEYIDWEAYEALLGDRTEYSALAAELGIEIESLYYNSEDESVYIYISEKGILYVYDPEIPAAVPFKFEVDGDNITIYNVDDEYVSELTFDGYEFYETESGVYYTP